MYWYFCGLKRQRNVNRTNAGRWTDVKKADNNFDRKDTHRLNENRSFRQIRELYSVEILIALCNIDLLLLFLRQTVRFLFFKTPHVIRLH